MKRNVICVLGLDLKTEWLEFLNKIQNYDVYYVLDKPVPVHLEHIIDKFPKVKIILIDDETCEKESIINMNFIIIPKKVIAWEKAVYYFSIVNTEYENIWFLEDDVFIYDENVFNNLDEKYPKADLLSCIGETTQDPTKAGWHWNRMKIEFPPPYYNTMVCGIRVSFNLLSDILNYARQYKTLFYLEALFPTICLKNPKLTHVTPQEMSTILYIKNWNKEDISKNLNNMFHPIKDMKKHIEFRN
jgi:hypothetical protein